MSGGIEADVEMLNMAGTGIARDHAELPAFRAGDACRPLKCEHQKQADPSEEEARERPADATGTRKCVAARQQEADGGYARPRAILGDASPLRVRSTLQASQAKLANAVSKASTFISF
jgi:hypothetical protein